MNIYRRAASIAAAVALAYCLTVGFAGVRAAPTEAADVNGDAVADVIDLSLLLAQYGSAGSADLDGSGIVDSADLSQLLAALNPGDDNPFRTTMLFNDQNYDPALAQAGAWRASRPADALQMDKIAGTPRAVWLGEWSGDISTEANRAVTAATQAGKLAHLVAYNIPERDCGGYSAGGLATPDAYRAWIQGLANGINNRKAVVILEPDAMAGSDCLDAAQRLVRYSLLSTAVTTLSDKGATVYIDAGHPTWLSAAEAASRLSQAGIAGARGFALNVSNFNSTEATVAYGNQVSALAGNKPFVVDTSRNGLGPGTGWCNPAGRALGRKPGPGTGRVDAYLWIKSPGESDGTCNGGPIAGAWWPEYALGLAQRATY